MLQVNYCILEPFPCDQSSKTAIFIMISSNRNAEKKLQQH